MVGGLFPSDVGEECILSSVCSVLAYYQGTVFRCYRSLMYCVFCGVCQVCLQTDSSYRVESGDLFAASLFAGSICGNIGFFLYDRALSWKR